MELNQNEIKELHGWLKGRLPALIHHGEQVRAVLKKVVQGDDMDAASKIVESSMDLVLKENPEQVQLTANQVAVWEALIPLLCKHGLLAIRTGGLALAEERSLTKKQAAEFLGISVRKLQVYMKRKQIRYEKYGTGRTAAVRFKLSELQRFQESRSVGGTKQNKA